VVTKMPNKMTKQVTKMSTKFLSTNHQEGD
jgi:hypothetical protein